MNPSEFEFIDAFIQRYSMFKTSTIVRVNKFVIFYFVSFLFFSNYYMLNNCGGINLNEYYQVYDTVNFNHSPRKLIIFKLFLTF